MSQKFRALAIHLPQFHPIPENNEWWGKGFTEWSNVAKTKPRFEGHYQPHLPSDLGFYDLRVRETRIAQAELAKENGISGFCYYHYWFNGRQVLETPVKEILKSKEPDFPFCLCWANENWTRNWDGMFNDVLLEQNYSTEDDINHIRFLFQFFEDKRYITVDEKPVFIVYRTELFPDIKRTTEVWREEAIKAGFKGLYLIRCENFTTGVDPETIGFDASFNFFPNHYGLPLYIIPGKIEQKLHEWNPQTVEYKRFPGLTPMWDNSARRKKNAMILKDSTPEEYGRWLKHITNTFEPFSKDENFIFVNAWNEWAEGNHLEPCQKWGRKYLEVTREVLMK
jgi:lipopolysaccharide biosynthesis protein